MGANTTPPAALKTSGGSSSSGKSKSRSGSKEKLPVTGSGGKEGKDNMKGLPGSAGKSDSQQLQGQYSGGKAANNNNSSNNNIDCAKCSSDAPINSEPAVPDPRQLLFAKILTEAQESMFDDDEDHDIAARPRLFSRQIIHSPIPEGNEDDEEEEDEKEDDDEGGNDGNNNSNDVAKKLNLNQRKVHGIHGDYQKHIHGMPADKVNSVGVAISTMLLDPTMLEALHMSSAPSSGNITPLATPVPPPHGLMLGRQPPATLSSTLDPESSLADLNGSFFTTGQEDDVDEVAAEADAQMEVRESGGEENDRDWAFVKKAQIEFIDSFDRRLAAALAHSQFKDEEGRAVTAAALTPLVDLSKNRNENLVQLEEHTSILDQMQRDVMVKVS
jgi:hypothetical protein